MNLADIPIPRLKTYDFESLLSENIFNMQQLIPDWKPSEGDIALKYSRGAINPYRRGCNLKEPNLKETLKKPPFSLNLPAGENFEPLWPAYGVGETSRGPIPPGEKFELEAWGDPPGILGVWGPKGSSYTRGGGKKSPSPKRKKRPFNTARGEKGVSFCFAAAQTIY